MAYLDILNEGNEFGSVDDPSSLASLRNVLQIVVDSKDKPQDVGIVIERTTYDVASDWPARIQYVAAQLRGSVKIVVPAGTLLDDDGIYWADALCQRIARYFIDKPFRMSLGVERIDEYVDICRVTSNARYYEMYPEAREEEELLTEARSRTVVLKGEVMRALIDSTKYVPVRERTLTKGDIVFEVVHYGAGAEHVKYREAKVLEPERMAANVLFNEDGRAMKIPFKRLVMLRSVWEERFPKEAARLAEEERVAAERQQQQKAVGAEDMSKDTRNVSQLRPAALVSVQKTIETSRPEGDFETWLSLGKDFLDSIDKERSQVEANITDLSDRLTKLDAQHQRDIDAIEKELREAKERHRQERAVFVSRSEHLKQKLESLKQRRSLLEYVVKEAK